MKISASWILHTHYHNLALEALLDSETINQADLAIKYSNIASICRKKEYYLQSSENYTNCLKIESGILFLRYRAIHYEK